MPGYDDLDSLTEAILNGTVSPSEVSDDLRPVVDLVAAMRGLAQAEAVAPPAGLVAMLAEAASMAPAAEPLPSDSPQEKKLLGKILTIKAAVAAAVLAVSVTGAAAANGSLPDAAQDGLAEAAEHVGINLPDSASDTAVEATQKDKGPEASVKAEEHANAKGAHDRDDDGEIDAVETADADGANAEANDHGETVSDLARSTEPGPDHGPTVSAVASDGKAGGQSADATENRQDAAHRAEQSTAPKPADTETDTAADGAVTADDASEGRSTDGLAKANERAGDAADDLEDDED